METARGCAALLEVLLLQTYDPSTSHKVVENLVVSADPPHRSENPV